MGEMDLLDKQIYSYLYDVDPYFPHQLSGTKLREAIFESSKLEATHDNIYWYFAHLYALGIVDDGEYNADDDKIKSQVDKDYDNFLATRAINNTLVISSCALIAIGKCEYALAYNLLKSLNDTPSTREYINGLPGCLRLVIMRMRFRQTDSLHTCIFYYPQYMVSFAAHEIDVAEYFCVHTRSCDMKEFIDAVANHDVDESYSNDVIAAINAKEYDALSEFGTIKDFQHGDNCVIATYENTTRSFPSVVPPGFSKRKPINKMSKKPVFISYEALNALEVYYKNNSECVIPTEILEKAVKQLCIMGIGAAYYVNLIKFITKPNMPFTNKLNTYMPKFGSQMRALIERYLTQKP